MDYSACEVRSLPFRTRRRNGIRPVNGDRMMRTKVLAGLTVAAAVLAGATTPVQAVASPPPAPTADHGRLAAASQAVRTARAAGAKVTVERSVRLSVALQPTADAAAEQAAAEAAGGRVRHGADELSGFSVTVPLSGEDHLRGALAARAGVAAVTETPADRLTYAVNDPALAAQATYLEQMSVPAAWDVTHGSRDVRIAVIDSGIDLTHPDFRRADGSSTVVATFNAVDGSDDVTDDVGHGTAVAGVAAAAADNSVGIAGVSFQASLLVAKVADAAGDVYADDTAAGITWAADQGADVINISLGSARSDPLEVQAVQYAESRGSLIVAAAGNESTSAPEYPAALPGVVAVGATVGNGRASFSNYGDWVDLGAPGTGIRVTAPVLGSSILTPSYDTADGTSFSSPLVAGAVGLLAAAYPDASAAQLADALATTTSAGAYGFGHGRVDVVSALRALAPKPISVLSSGPAPFSPNGDGHRETFGVSYQTTEPLTVTATVVASSGAPVMSAELGTVGPGPAAWQWNGRDSSNLVAPDGTYVVRLTATTADGAVSTVATSAVLDRTAPALTALSGSGSVFYPVNDGYRDTFTPAVTTAEPLTAVQLRIYNSTGALLRTIQSSAGTGRVSLSWNGRRGDGSLYPEGTYRFSFVARDAAENVRATGTYPVTLSQRRLSPRTGTATVTPSQSRVQLLVGDCSAVRGPAYGSGWTGSYDLLSDYYFPDCATELSTSDLAASVHQFTLPVAAKYGNVKVSAYGRSYPHYTDTAVLLYFDKNDEPTSSGRVLGATAATYAASSVSPTNLINGRTLHWSVATDSGDWYQVKSFTVTWTYYVLA